MIMQNHNIEDIRLSKILSRPYWAKNKQSNLQQSACGLLARLDLSTRIDAHTCKGKYEQQY